MPIRLQWRVIFLNNKAWKKIRIIGVVIRKQRKLEFIMTNNQPQDCCLRAWRQNHACLAVWAKDLFFDSKTMRLPFKWISHTHSWSQSHRSTCLTYDSSKMLNVGTYTWECDRHFKVFKLVFSRKVMTLKFSVITFQQKTRNASTLNTLVFT